MPKKLGGGGHASEAYDEKTGRYMSTSTSEDGSVIKRVDENRTHNLDVTFWDGTSAKLYNSNDYNPFEVQSDDSFDTVFDKLIAMPLMIKHANEWALQHLPEGSKILRQGFGDLKIDEPLGKDFRITVKLPDGTKKYMSFDFKAIKTSLGNTYDETAIPLHLFRKSFDAQFLNGKHANTHFLFLSIDTKKNRKQLIDMVQNGQNINDVIKNVKFKLINSKSLHKVVFTKLMSEQELRNRAKTLANDLRRGFFDTRESEMVYGDRDIERIKTQNRDFNGNLFEKTNTVKETIHMPFGDWQIYSTMRNPGEVDTGMSLRGNIQETLLGPFMHEKEIPFTKKY